MGEDKDEQTSQPTEEAPGQPDGTQPTEEAPGQPDGTQPATIPGAENPESEEVKDEKNPNTE